MILGDSCLVIDFATCKARPGKASLFLKVREVQSLVKKLRWGKKCGEISPCGEAVECNC